MTTPLSIAVPFPVFQDRDGQPLENGYVWLGVANLNPQTNPVIAYFDAALTIVAPQPLRTLNGYISRAGTPAQVFIDGANFSILVQDSKGSMVYNFADATGIEASVNASNVVYDPAGIGAVPTTVQAKLRETLSVQDFGAVGDGVADDTAAIQAAITASKTQNNRIVYLPAGTYLVTDTIYLYGGAQIQGDAINYAGGRTDSLFGLPNAVKTTVINFNPSSEKTLFEMDGSPNVGSSYRGIGVENLSIFGNTTPSDYWKTLYGSSAPVVTTSKYAFDLTRVSYSRFANISIRNFQSGIRLTITQVNLFDGIDINFCRNNCVLYAQDVNVPTSDVWRNCIFRTSPTGVYSEDTYSVQIRFQNCLFESLDNFGVQLPKAATLWSFIDTYAENVPANVASTTGAMFQGGFYGSAATNIGLMLIVVGGQYGGNNTGGLIGDFATFDSCNGASFAAPFVARYARAIRSTANTVTDQISCAGLQWVQSGGFSDGPTRIVGFYNSAAINSSVGPSARFTSASAATTTSGIYFLTPGPYWRADATSPEGVYTAPVGSIFSRTNGGAGTTFYVKESGTGNTGWVAK